MEFTGQSHIKATQEAVWLALNDAVTLKQSIPGCQELNQTADGGFEAKVTAKIGPVKATFKGKVVLENINPPHSYTIVGEGQGGVAGFASGSADVSLKYADDHVTLSYQVNAQIGGKLAQIGSRLITGSVKKLSDQFFDNFCKLVETPIDEQSSSEPMN